MKDQEKTGDCAEIFIIVRKKITKKGQNQNNKNIQLD